MPDSGRATRAFRSALEPRPDGPAVSCVETQRMNRWSSLLSTAVPRSSSLARALPSVSVVPTRSVAPRVRSLLHHCGPNSFALSVAEDSIRVTQHSLTSRARVVRNETSSSPQNQSVLYLPVAHDTQLTSSEATTIATSDTAHTIRHSSQAGRLLMSLS